MKQKVLSSDVGNPLHLERGGCQEVNGDLPVPFVTITSNVTKLNGETA